MNFFSNKKSPKAISDSIAKVLAEPFIPEFSDYVQKIRRNCVAISCLVLIMVYGGVSVSPDLATSGFKLKGIDDALVKTLLLILTIYWLIHFLWCALDYFGEWRIRLTNIKENLYSWDADDKATSKATRNSTFLSWMYFNHEPTVHFRHQLDELKELLQKADMDQPDKSRIEQNIASGIMTLQNATNVAEEMLKAYDLRMRRFESWWRMFQASSSIRWLVIELLLPIFLGAIAIGKLTPIVIGPLLQGWLC